MSGTAKCDLLDIVAEALSDMTPAQIFYEAIGQKFCTADLAQKLDPEVIKQEEKFRASLKKVRERVEALDDFSTEEKDALIRLLLDVEETYNLAVFAYSDAIFSGMVSTLAPRLMPWALGKGGGK